MITDNLPDNLVTNKVSVRTRRLMLAGIFLAFIVFPLIMWVTVLIGKNYIYQLICSRVLIWGALGLLCLYANYVEGQRFLLWPEHRYKFKFFLVSIILLYLLSSAAGLVARIPFWLGWHEHDAKLLKIMQVMKQYPAMIILVSITAAITEELVFRGYMISRLSLFFKNKYVPVLICALLFCAEHLTYKSLQEIIFTFLIGLILGYHYEKYRNIKITIAVHFLIDFLSLFVYIMQK